MKADSWFLVVTDVSEYGDITENDDHHYGGESAIVWGDVSTDVAQIFMPYTGAQ